MVSRSAFVDARSASVEEDMEFAVLVRQAVFCCFLGRACLWFCTLTFWGFGFWIVAGAGVSIFVFEEGAPSVKEF